MYHHFKSFKVVVHLFSGFWQRIYFVEKFKPLASGFLINVFHVLPTSELFVSLSEYGEPVLIGWLHLNTAFESSGQVTLDRSSRYKAM